VYFFGLTEVGHLFDPADEVLVGGGRGGGWCTFHRMGFPL
jgi:hypothetical protein